MLTSTTPPASPRIALAGAHGFGAVHLANIERLGSRVQLVGVADPQPPTEGELPSGTAVFADLATLLRAVEVDVVIIATPLHTHAELAELAMRAGCDVLVEKPPVSTLAAFRSLLDLAGKTGSSVQVGFQSLGSSAVPALSDGVVGAVRAVSATGLWSRPKGYWGRSDWAGKRMLDGRPVVDGVVTNPLAHAVATALAIAGTRTLESVMSVETDLYRANDIDSDDTSVVRIRTTEGITVTCALTLAAAEHAHPGLTDAFVTVRGENGDARLYYTQDKVVVDGQTTSYERVDLLENLLAHRRDGEPLLSSLEQSGAFMAVLEAIRTAPDPHPIAPEHIEWVGEGSGAHPVVADIEHWVTKATDAAATFAELRAPFARPLLDHPLGSLTADGIAVAEYVDGSTITPTSSPRPFLHPVRTLGGVVVTGAHPPDHDWHFGVSVAVQDVDGVNFWGGRTYVRGDGYQWRDDHGRIVSTGIEASTELISDRLGWLAGDREMVVENREMAASVIDGGWMLDLSFVLETPTSVVSTSLGSPGTNGREGGGYGGFTWRIADCENVDVRTTSARGEAGVHGSQAPWLAWTADFAAGPATMIFVSGDPSPNRDPWFVRVAAYPGVGSALAWSERAVLRVARSFRVIVADGRLDDETVERLVARIGEHRVVGGR